MKKISIVIATLLFIFGTVLLTNQTLDAANKKGNSIKSPINKTSQKSSEISTSDQIITKEEIQNRMLNSIDYFNSVKGSFIYHSDTSNYHFEVDYKVQTKNTPSSWSKIVAKHQDNKVVETTFDGKKRTVLDHKNKKYLKTDVMKQKWDKEKFKKPEDRYGVKDGEPLYIFRPDPTFMDIEQTSLFPQDLALGFLKDYDMWNIKSEDKLHGLDVLVLEGELNNHYQNKHQAKTFKLWVHKQTGILLKFEEYNEDKQAVVYLKTTSIKVNDTIDANKFKLNIPDDYKDQFKQLKENRVK